MKKKLLLSLCTLALSANAQFRVQSDGKVAIQTSHTALSPISINGAGDSSYYISCKTSELNGITMSTYGNYSGNLYGGSFNTSGAGIAVGVKTYTANATLCVGLNGYAIFGNKTIGVVGATNQSYTNLGAGVYGTVYGDMGSALTSGIYAGFFNGNVKVTGSITTGSTIQGALLGESAGESGSTTNGLSPRAVSLTACLSGLNVTTYQKERPEMFRDLELIDTPEGDTLPEAKKPEPDVMEEQFYKKTHYALDADRLEETFPDLVYVREDGSKVINYMEMIPLLVQSINELKQELDAVKGESKAMTRSISNESAGFNATATGNVLYQNNPNPFKEQTTIRFSLADDVQDAAICIFDMTGKMLKKLPISSGMNSVSFGGYELGEGMFLYSLIVNGQVIDTKRMVISK